jgi:hypothetical protein
VLVSLLALSNLPVNQTTAAFSFISPALSPVSIFTGFGLHGYSCDMGMKQLARFLREKGIHMNRT